MLNGPAQETTRITNNSQGSTRHDVLPLETWLVRQILRALNHVPIFIQLPDGSRVNPPDVTPELGIIIHTRRALWLFISNPALRFGEEYAKGNIEVVGDIVAFMLAIYRARPALHKMSFFNRYVVEGIRRRRNNTYQQSRDNVHHHYDIGNDFYKLWLDEDLVYTCAYFPGPTATLEQAQRAKLDYVCRKLRLQPGETVVDAGCGWGALAIHMARYYGVKVRAYNVSHEQIVEATARAKRLGLDGQVTFIEDDYRNISGRFDVFTSVGMLEHVGTAHYKTLGGVIDNSLTDKGRGLLHSIGQTEACAMNPWLVKHIFPGGYAPTLREMMGVFEPRGFSIMDVENLRLHYARTIEHWLQRFNQQEDKIRRMFDAEFVRTWRLYLAASIATFQQGGAELYQILFSREAVNDIPLTRAHLYNDDAEPDTDGQAWRIGRARPL